MKYVRCYADEAGESHFEDVEVNLTLMDFASPAPPLALSPFVTATQVGFLSAPSGWYGDWHPSPRRQFLIFLSGKSKIAVSDGEIRQFASGSVLLLEDTSGKGHISVAISKEPVVHVVVQLPE